MRQQAIQLVTSQQNDDAIIQEALGILSRRMHTGETTIGSPADAKNFVKLKMAGFPDEKFLVLFLNTRHRVVHSEILFHGTVNQSAVHPRVIIREALKWNASAVILAHNHPSGDPTPSQSDRHITDRIRDGLGMLDIRVLDHLVVGCSPELEIVSFAETGLL